MVLKKIVAMPAPSKMNHGMFFGQVCQSFFNEVFSVTGSMRSRSKQK